MKNRNTFKPRQYHAVGKKNKHVNNQSMILTEVIFPYRTNINIFLHFKNLKM